MTPANHEEDAVPQAGARIEGSRPKLKRFAVASIILFSLAMLFPALGTCPQIDPGNVDWLPNHHVLFYGPLGAFFLEFGWYANIPLAIVLVAIARGRPVSRWIIVTQVILTLSSFVPVELIGPSESATTICRWGPGYWMWFAAQSIAVAGAVLSRRSSGF
jgi:hypothetical protein